MPEDFDLENGWLICDNDFWYSDEEEMWFDEDFAYESRRDMELE